MYKPAGFPARNLAASSAPRAKPSRLSARWLNSRVSPSRPKTTVCSPGESAIRRAWILISPRADPAAGSLAGDQPLDALAGDLGQPKGRPAGSVFLGPVMPLHDRDVGRLAQRPGGLAHQSHQKIDGPAHVGRDQDRDPGGRRFQKLARWLASKPVVPTTRGIFRSRQSSATASVAGGSEKSIMTSTATSAGRDEPSATPSGATPARAPASCPRLGMAVPLQRRGQLERRDPGR